MLTIKNRGAIVFFSVLLGVLLITLGCATTSRPKVDQEEAEPVLEMGQAAVEETQGATGQVTLTWDASMDPELGGYRVYYGAVSRDYDVSLDVGNWTSCTIASLQEGETYYFAVTAYNNELSESGYSNEVSIKIGSESPPRSMPWVPLLLDD
jgi:fibronectin type 3 domain-containing protein